MAKVFTQKLLLDSWTPPQILHEDGTLHNPVPVGFISTSFTFDAEFFEEECLTRFLVMETEKENDGPAFLIEKEEKLAGLGMGLVLVDQAHCRGARSLRWHLIPCRVKHGIMHAKITILQWSDCIRLIIGSANLTKPGYCINQEVFSCIDYYPESETNPAVLNSVLSYLKAMVTDFCGQIITNSFESFQAGINAAIRQWGLTETVYKKDDVALTTLLVSPQQNNALETLRTIWDANFNSPPDEAHIISPFYDTIETEATPSRKIFENLQQRGAVSTYYYLPAQLPEDPDSDIIIQGPEFLAKKIKDNQQIYFVRVPEEGKNEKDSSVIRPMHLKQLWLSKRDYCLIMLGSSNFTSAAFGTGKRVNYEANLVYTFDESRNKEAKKWMNLIYPENEIITTDNFRFKQSVNEDDIQAEQEFPNLPLFFSEAIIRKVNDEFYLELKFNLSHSDPPTDFKIWYERSGTKEKYTCILTQKEWMLSGKSEVILKWVDEVLPDSLLVNWQNSINYSFWPVIVENQATLPPVEALRNLPLEALLYILSSSQPLHRLLKVIEKMKREKAKNEIEYILDPHLLVDTSKFLLQRTRRVSFAMKAMRERLEKPVYTHESLEWRLSGPIGIESLKEAILREAQSSEEKYFLFAELALELSRVSPQETELSLKKEIIKAEIRKVLTRIADELNAEGITGSEPVKDYSRNAIKKSLYEL